MIHETKIIITIDTREQTPLHFEEYMADTKRGTLKNGDYALSGDLGFSIERKSIDDFVRTISTGWKRFKRELNRMKKLKYPSRIIVIEANLFDCCFTVEEGEPKHNHNKVTPRFIFLRIVQLSYAGVQVIFAGNRELSALLTWRLLLQRQYELNGIELEKI